MVKLLKNSVVSVAFVGGDKMAELNKKYRGKNGAVPVLTFPIGERGPDGINRLGDVIICASLAKELAKEKNKLVNEVIKELIWHGISKVIDF